MATLNKVSAAITAENAFTDFLPVTNPNRNFFSIKVDGTFSATVSVQYKRPGEVDSAAVDDDETFTAPFIKNGVLNGHWLVRAGVKTGNFTSGTVNIVIYKDGRN